MTGVAFVNTALLTASCLLCAAGCSTPPAPLFPVTGTITVHKLPLIAGTVVFHPDPAKGNLEKREPHATIGGDNPGGYRLITDQQDGAPSGWYRVTVFALKPPAKAMQPAEWLADPKYADEKTAGLSVEVKADAQTLDFDLDPPTHGR